MFLKKKHLIQRTPFVVCIVTLGFQTDSLSGRLGLRILAENSNRNASVHTNFYIQKIKNYTFYFSVVRFKTNQHHIKVRNCKEDHLSDFLPAVRSNFRYTAQIVTLTRTRYFQNVVALRVFHFQKKTSKKKIQRLMCV